MACRVSPTPHAARPDRAQQGTRNTGALRGVGLLPDPEPFWRRIEPGALGSVSVLLALILGLGYAGLTVLKEVQRVQVAPADIVPNVVSDINPLAPATPDRTLAANDTDPLVGAGTALRREGTETGTGVAEGIVRIARPQALDVPVLIPRDGPIAAIVPEAANRMPADPRARPPMPPSRKPWPVWPTMPPVRRRFWAPARTRWNCWPCARLGCACAAPTAR